MHKKLRNTLLLLWTSLFLEWEYQKLLTDDYKNTWVTFYLKHDDMKFQIYKKTLYKTLTPYIVIMKDQLHVPKLFKLRLSLRDNIKYQTFRRLNSN